MIDYINMLELLNNNKYALATTGVWLTKAPKASTFKNTGGTADSINRRVVDITPLSFSDLPESQRISRDAQKVNLQGATISHNLVIKNLADGDVAWNYDFMDPQSHIVDWPVTIIFCGPSATVENIKKHYWDAVSADVRWGEFKNQGSWEQIGDTGTKSGGRIACHMRLYAHIGICNYNSELGQYVIATTHYDKNEGWWWPGRHQVGWSEDAALEIAAKIPSGWWIESAKSPEYDWHNYEGGYWIDNHYYQCDGYITLIHTSKP